MLAMRDLDLAGKRVLIREDFNVPLKNGRITDDTRLRAGLPTLQAAVAAGARVIVVSHLGRPKEGVFDEASSMTPVAQALTDLLGQPVRLVRDWLSGVECAPGEVVLCENVRFEVGEEKDDEALAKRMAALCDHLFAVPSRSTPAIQEVHLCLYHHFCAAVEDAIAG